MEKSGLFFQVIRDMLKTRIEVGEKYNHYREHSSSQVECLFEIEGLWVQTSPEPLCCVLEQDTLILA